MGNRGSRNSFSDSRRSIFSATRNDAEILAAILQTGADVNEFNHNGNVPLILAANKGYDQYVELFIQAGADVNVVDRHGRTALITTVENCKYQSVEKVLKAGADVNIRNARGCTALLSAAKEINYKCVELLVKSGADVNVVNNDGYTPIKAVVHKADLIFQSGLIFIYSKALNCVNLFLKSGAHVNNSSVHDSRPIREHVEQRKSPKRRKLLMLLYAAGENIDGSTVEKVETDGAVSYVNVSDILVERELKIGLKHLCREAIRKQLLEVNSPVNLFHKVRDLGLPPLIINYLLYDMSLDM